MYSDYHSYREHFKISLKDVLKLWIKSHIQGVFRGTPRLLCRIAKLKNCLLGVSYHRCIYSSPQTFRTRDVKQMFLGSRLNMVFTRLDLDSLLWPWPVTFDLHNLIRSSVGLLNIPCKFHWDCSKRSWDNTVINIIGSDKGMEQTNKVSGGKGIINI